MDKIKLTLLYRNKYITYYYYYKDKIGRCYFKGGQGMSESSDEIRQEAVNSCLFVMIIQSKNNCFVSKRVDVHTQLLQG